MITDSWTAERLLLSLSRFVWHVRPIWVLEVNYDTQIKEYIEDPRRMLLG